MNQRLHLRIMTHADLTFGDSLRSLAGWNQTIRDWRRFLVLAPDGCFIAEWDGSPAGTVTTTSYGTELAWIGMLLVHPDLRRHGIGTALLQHGLDHLSRRGIECVKLDATQQGKPIYESLGFREEWPLTRWEREDAESLGQSGFVEPDTGINRAPPGSCGLRSMAGEDWDTVTKLDAEAFGVSRRRLLESFLADDCQLEVRKGPAGLPAGYGIKRPGATADYLGPIVADSVEMGLGLIVDLHSQSQLRRVYWDIPDQNSAAVDLAKKIGFTPQRPLMRMYRGENGRPGNPRLQYAIADPAIG